LTDGLLALPCFPSETAIATRLLNFGVLRR